MSKASGAAVFILVNVLSFIKKDYDGGACFVYTVYVTSKVRSCDVF